MGRSLTAARTTAFRVRVGLLLFVLFVVVAWAVRDVRSRRARTDWDHTLRIAVVLIEKDKVSPTAIAAFRERRSAMEDRMRDELRRHRPPSPMPFSFTVLGPAPIASMPPTPAGESLSDLAAHQWAMWRWLSAVDRAAGVDTWSFDSRIYVVVSPLADGEVGMIEGVSEQGGRVGTVHATLDEGMADFAWAVVVHELFHTLGATDKYDERGRTLIPDGLAEPDARPQLPQRFVEIMARNRPVSMTEEKAPTSISDVAVGPTTAREIRWAGPDARLSGRRAAAKTWLTAYGKSEPPGREGRQG